MFGNLLSEVIKIATLPVDAASAAADIATGGDGSKASRTDNGASPFSLAENLRDQIADAAKSSDK